MTQHAMGCLCDDCNRYTNSAMGVVVADLNKSTPAVYAPITNTEQPPKSEALRELASRRKLLWKLRKAKPPAVSNSKGATG